MHKARVHARARRNLERHIMRESQGVNRRVRSLCGSPKSSLSVLEMRFTLFDEGRHAFFLVMGGKHGLEKAAFVANALG